MAQYLFSVLDETAGSGTEEEMAAIGAFNRQLKADGNWVFAAGLAAPEAATVVDGRGGAEPVFSDGPYLESKEFIAGIWIIEAPHLDEALRLAGLASRVCNRRLEIRPLLGP